MWSWYFQNKLKSIDCYATNYNCIHFKSKGNILHFEIKNLLWHLIWIIRICILPCFLKRIPIIHIGVYAVYLHKFPVKHTNLFLGSPVVFGYPSDEYNIQNQSNPILSFSSLRISFQLYPHLPPFPLPFQGQF